MIIPVLDARRRRERREKQRRRRISKQIATEKARRVVVDGTNENTSVEAISSTSSTISTGREGITSRVESTQSVAVENSTMSSGNGSGSTVLSNKTTTTTAATSTSTVATSIRPEVPIATTTNVLGESSISSHSVETGSHSYIYVNSFPSDFPVETLSPKANDGTGRGYIMLRNNKVGDSMLLFTVFFISMLIITYVLVKCNRILERRRGGGKVDTVVNEDTSWAEGREVVERKIVYRYVDNASSNNTGRTSRDRDRNGIGSKLRK